MTGKWIVTILKFKKSSIIFNIKKNISEIMFRLSIKLSQFWWAYKNIYVWPHG